jgi:hypothetical protein
MATLALALWSGSVLAADTDACIEQYDASVAARKRGALLEARAGYATCASASCPKEIEAECERGVQAMTKEVPTLVFVMRRSDGADVTHGRLTIDGRDVPRAVEGLPVEVDPGTHELELQLADGRTLVKTIVARAGERNRSVLWEVPLKEKPKPATRQTQRGRNVLGPILLGVGGAALASFGVFAVLGRSKQSELEDCKPGCAPGDIDEMQRLYLVADISLAVSVVAIGGGSYFLLRTQPGESAFLGIGGRL